MTYKDDTTHDKGIGAFPDIDSSQTIISKGTRTKLSVLGSKLLLLPLAFLFSCPPHDPLFFLFSVRSGPGMLSFNDDLNNEVSLWFVRSID